MNLHLRKEGDCYKAKRHILAAYVVAAIALAALLLERGCNHGGGEGKIQPRAFVVAKTDTVVRYDTVIKTRRVVRLVNVPSTRIDTLRDTLIVDKPFVASLDTIAQGDTIGVKFQFPEKTFSLSVKSKPDSIAVRKEFITLTNTVYAETPFVEKVGWGAIGFAVGAVVGIGATVYISK